MAQDLSSSRSLTYPDGVRRGMRQSIVEGAAFSLWFYAVSGNYLTGLVLYLGADGFTIGLLGAIPPLAMVLQVLCAPTIVGRYPRTRLLAFLMGIQRFSWVLAGLLALALPRGLALPTFLVLYSVSWIANAPAGLVWQELMSDLIPGQVRGHYFGVRAAWVQAVGMSTMLLCGWLMDRWPGADGLRAVYSIGLAGAALDVAAWLNHHEPPTRPHVVRGAFWETVWSPLRRPSSHRTATFFFAVWNLAQGLAVPFYSLALIQHLNLSFQAASILTILAGLAAVVTAPFWGRLQDSKGDRWAIGLLVSLLALVPLLFTLAGQGGMPLLILVHLVHGTAFNGFQLAALNLNIKLAPPEHRSAYLAMLGAVSGLTGFLAPLAVGGLTTKYLEPVFLVAAVASGALALLWWAKLGHVVSRQADASPGTPSELAGT